MASQPRSVLPTSLSAKLSALHTSSGRKKSDQELEEILVDLSALPANAVVRASREIAKRARLGWWQRERSLIDQLFGSSVAEQDLLARNPDYAWLLVFHPNGYVREDVLNSIDSPPTSPFFFAALAWRLNDWVAPVRQAAERCAKRVLHRASPDVAAKAALYLLDRRLVWGRWSDEPRVLDTVFGREDVIAALARQLQQSTGVRATSLRNALRYPDIDQHLPRLAATAAQPSVRAVACQCLTSGKASWSVGFEWAWVDKVYGLRRRVPKLEARDVRRTRPAAEFIREAAHDKSPLVRRIAADALIAARSRLPDEAALVAHLAKDRSSAIRSRADFMLRHPPSGRSS
jgi:hypothetical protein